MLGAEEIDASVGRLLPSRYVEFLPYLGAFILAGDRFRTKPSGFTVYETKGGVKSTELSGWFARWLKGHDFHQVHHRVDWKILNASAQCAVRRKLRRSKLMSSCIGFVFNGILLTASILAGDWWGFANALSMIASVAVRVSLRHQHRCSIDKAIRDATNISGNPPESQDDSAQGSSKDLKPGTNMTATIDPPAQPCDTPKNTRDPLPDLARAIIVLDDSRCVYMEAPKCLMATVFAKPLEVPNKSAYGVVRCIGWMAFAVQVILLGMSTLLIQVGTVILLLNSNILIITKFSCEDSNFWITTRHCIKSTSLMRHSFKAPPTAASFDPLGGMTCVIGSLLQARCSQVSRKCVCGVDPHQRSSTTRPKDAEKQKVVTCNSLRRQDLFVWLQLTELEEILSERWALLPSKELHDFW